MIARPCDNCQGIYDAEPRYLNRGQGRFCSRSCSAAYSNSLRHGAPNTQCSWCGIDFYRKPSKKKSKSGLYFCSKEHQNNAVKNNMYSTGPKPTGRSKWNPNGRCLRCDKKYSGSHDACQNCRKKQVIEAWLLGDNSVTLSRSKTTGLPTETKKFVKEYLIKTRGDRCEICGFDEKAPDGRSIIQMDHINGNCFDNRLENLRLLCPNHHAMTTTYGSLNKGSGRAHRRKSN